MNLQRFVRAPSAKFISKPETMLGIILWGSTLCAAWQDDAPGVKFTRHGVVLGTAERQTVVPGFFLGGGVADLAVVHIDENGDRRLRLYTLGDGTWAPALETALKAEVLFVDVANIGARDRLITYQPNGLSWFDPESNRERALVAVDCGFDRPRKDEVPHVDVTRDVNGDGDDDLVVPAVDGFRIFIQTENGSFAEPVEIGPPPDLRGIYGADGYRYDPWSESRIHEMDYNHDGRGDLVFWNGDHFAAHLQNERGLFSPVAVAFTTDVAFDSDDRYALATGDMTGRVLHALADVNGDGIGDLVVRSLTGLQVSKKRSTFEVHLGGRTPDGGTAFASRAGITFHTDDKIQLGMDRRDFDGDGFADVMLTTIDVRHLSGSLWKSIKGFMGDDIWLELEFYRNESGRFSETPNAVRRIALDGVPSHREPGSVPLAIVLRGATHESRRTQKVWGKAFNSTLLTGDVDGDGLSDLIVGHHPRQLEVCAGVAGPSLFSQQTQPIRIPVPNDEEYTRLLDLNRDGKQDILMHHPFVLRDGHGAPLRQPGTEPQRVTMLIAR